MAIKNEILQISKWAERMKSEIGTVFFGKDIVIEKILVGLLCRGHILLEDVPGVGKTILARAIAACLGGDFKRLQCTPDLLPTDVLGVSIFNPGNGEFEYRKGPVHSNILLVDEINRATPRTQSALLEAMAENQISVDGEKMRLPDPFFIIATENPIEFEGTFPLPEAQKDRFFLSLKIGYPSREAESLILESHKRIDHPVNDIKSVTDVETVTIHQKSVVDIHVSEILKEYILEIVNKSRESDYFLPGISPRGSLALYKGSQALAAIRGRDYIVPEDIKELAVPIFVKRVILKTKYQIKGITEENAIEELLTSVPVPGINKADEN